MFLLRKERMGHGDAAESICNMDVGGNSKDLDGIRGIG